MSQSPAPPTLTQRAMAYLAVDVENPQGARLYVLQRAEIHLLMDLLYTQGHTALSLEVGLALERALCNGMHSQGQKRKRLLSQLLERAEEKGLWYHKGILLARTVDLLLEGGGVQEAERVVGHLEELVTSLLVAPEDQPEDRQILEDLVQVKRVLLEAHKQREVPPCGEQLDVS